MSIKRSKLISVCICLSVLFQSILQITTIAAEGVVVKNASQDTFVGPEDVGVNSVSAYSHIQITKNSWGYVSFNLDSVKGINYKATLTLTMFQRVPASDTAKLGIYGVDNQDWMQGTIIGATRPQPTDRIAQVTLKKDEEIEIDVTRYVRKNKSKRGNVSFVFFVDDNSGNTVLLYSTEHGRGPKLTFDRAGYDESLYGGPEPTPTPTPTPQTSTATNTAPEPTPLPPREEREYFVPEPDTSVLPPDIDIDGLTTTRTAPWMVNYHLTTIEQAKAGYHGGECGQYMVCVDISPTDPNRMITGHDTCTVWLSDDGGKTWQNKAEGLKLMGVVDVRFDPDNSDVIYLAAHPYLPVSGHHKLMGIYKTENFGKTWNQVNEFQFAERYGQKNIIDFSEKNAEGKRSIYVGAKDGVMRSDDGGVSWESMELPNEKITSLQIIDKDIIVTSGDGNIYVSENGDKEWHKRSEGLSGESVGSVAVDPFNFEHWYTNDSQKIYESFDSGKSWKEKKTKEDMKISGSIAAIRFNKPKEKGQTILYIVAEKNSPNLFYSTDYGITIKKADFVNKDVSFMKDNYGWFSEAFRVFPNDWDKCMVSVDGEMCYGWFENGKLNLKSSSSGISGLRVKSIAFEPDNPNNMYFATTDRGVIKIIDSGKNENYPLGYYIPFEDRYFSNIRYKGEKTTHAIAIDPRNTKRLICHVGNWQTGILKESLNGGLSWLDLPAPEIGATCIQFNTNNPDIIYAGGIISYDNGETWTKSKRAVNSVSQINNDIVYGSGADKIYVSYNCGKDWEMFNSVSIPGIQNITPDLHEKDKLYVGSFLSGMAIVTRNSIEWIGTANGMVNSAGGVLPIMDIAQNPENKEHLLAGGVDNLNGAVSGGLFESKDGGKSWKVIEGVTGSKDIWEIVFHPLKPIAYITTSQGTFAYEYENWYDRNENYFKDVNADNQYINALVEQGTISGYPDGNYYPENGVTRGEFAKLISNFIKSYNVEMNFSDVSKSSWYYKYINTVAANDIMIGAQGKFRPNDKITHEEAMCVIARVLNAKQIISDFDMPEANAMFADYDISSYAIYSVYKCYCEKVFEKNDEDFIFSPKKELTRGEAAVLLYKVGSVM